MKTSRGSIPKSLHTITVLVAVARALARDNPRFDRARFLAACGVVS